jgi:hypothetical protein
MIRFESGAAHGSKPILEAGKRAKVYSFWMNFCITFIILCLSRVTTGKTASGQPAGIANRGWRNGRPPTLSLLSIER